MPAGETSVFVVRDKAVMTFIFFFNQPHAPFPKCTPKLPGNTFFPSFFHVKFNNCVIILHADLNVTNSAAAGELFSVHPARRSVHL